MILGIGDVERSTHVYRDRTRKIERRLPFSGDCGDQTTGSHLADPIVVGIRDIQVPDKIKRDAPRPAQLRYARLSAIAAEARLPGPRECRDSPIDSNLPDAMIPRVGDIEV